MAHKRFAFDADGYALQVGDIVRIDQSRAWFEGQTAVIRGLHFQDDDAPTVLIVRVIDAEFPTSALASSNKCTLLPSYRIARESRSTGFANVEG